MQSKAKALRQAGITLRQLYDDYHDKGLVSVYLWGSIITPDFDPTASDIDAVGILSDAADFSELNKIRDWLPLANSTLRRLQINFFYVSELKGEGPVRSRLARLYSARQAVYDFPHWMHVCGAEYRAQDFPAVIPRQFLSDQIQVVQERKKWAAAPASPLDTQYYCKSLVWLCYAIHKLDHPVEAFTWDKLQQEVNTHTATLVRLLVKLKSHHWANRHIDTALPVLFAEADRLIKEYQ